MPHSTGWFVNAKTHELRQIHEHATAVVTDPESYGFLKSETEGLQPRRDRAAILKKAMELGWIRVRRRKSDASIEFSCTWIEAMVAVGANLEGLGCGPLTLLIFRHIETGEEEFIYANDLGQALNGGQSVLQLRGWAGSHAPPLPP